MLKKYLERVNDLMLAMTPQESGNLGAGSHKRLCPSCLLFIHNVDELISVINQKTFGIVSGYYFCNYPEIFFIRILIRST